MISLESFMLNLEYYIHEAKLGKIFIYPTDTIYGIGSIVNNLTVSQIYNIKQRDITKPLSVLAPDIRWIKNNFICGDDFDKLFEDFQNQFNATTLLMIKKDKNFLSEISTNNKVGIRIIKHPFQDFVKNLGQAFITTSANISGEGFAKDISTMNKHLLTSVDYIIDGGELDNNASIIIDFQTKETLNRY